MTMWMVRAGEGAHLFGNFKDKNFIAIGWNDLGDLSGVQNQSEIKTKMRQVYPDYREGKIVASAGQINRFKFAFKKGDKVITYSPETRIYLIGEIVGDYEYNTKLCDYYHIRMVKWLGELPRDKLSTSTKNTLGAISTIFDLGNEATQEVIKQLTGKSESKIEESKSDEGLDEIKEDVINKAHEFIKDQIIKLSWEDAQRLVGGILRGMGYKTRISPPGSDRGKDIVASIDGLGLEGPKIIVQVKHRNNQMGSNEIRSFKGGLRPGHKGVYVSTGGFSKEANYEADRSDIPITLVDLDELVDLLVQHYDKFDTETKALIPLTKIYWPE